MHGFRFSSAFALTLMTVVAPALAATAAPATSNANPLLPQWSGPYGGVPPFDKAKVADFKPALEASMTEELKEIDAIATSPAKPDFENTIAALERAGRTFDRVTNVFNVYSSTMSTPEFQAVESEMAPKLSAFGDQIVQNEQLFARVKAVYDERETLPLTPEQKRIVWLDYTNFVRAGANLDQAAKDRMSAINQRLATLFTNFSQNLLADETDYMLVLDKEADLAGLPAPMRAAAAAAAE
ncbi:MAG: M3 family peptidase, partial [Acidobacteriota bacterium]